MTRTFTLFCLSLILISVGLSGCSNVSYYSQSVVGHSKLMLARQPIDKVMESVEPELKAQLQLSQELRQFAFSELSLPTSKSYTSYVPLEREFPVWTVVAAPEFSLDAKQWCYPVIGCASYRGYFRKSAALDYAKKQQAKGFETSVGGAPAYSTLGWFSDPLLPSMMRHGDVGLAETLFHELAHQELYINGDSDFNEAFATVVGEEGTVRWLTKNRPDALDSYRERQLAYRQFNSLIGSSKNKLSAVYEGNSTAAVKAQNKSLAFAELEQNYISLKESSWRNKGWFDNWFKTPINNARLAAFSTYRDRVPELRALLSECNNELPRFYAVLKKAKKKDKRVQVPTNCV